MMNVNIQEWLKNLKATLMKVSTVIMYRYYGVKYDGSLWELFMIKDERKKRLRKINCEMQSKALSRPQSHILLFNKDQPNLYILGEIPRGWYPELGKCTQRHKESDCVKHAHKRFRQLFGVFESDAITFDENNDTRNQKRAVLKAMIQDTPASILKRVDYSLVQTFKTKLGSGVQLTDIKMDKFVRAMIYPCWFGSIPEINMDTPDEDCRQTIKKLILDETTYTNTTFLYELRMSDLSMLQQIGLCFEICRAVGNITDVFKDVITATSFDEIDASEAVRHAYLTNPPEKEIRRVVTETQTHGGLTIFKGTTVIIPVALYNSIRGSCADLSFGFGAKGCPARGPAIGMLKSIIQILQSDG